MPAMRAVIFQWSEADSSSALVVFASALSFLRTLEVCIASIADLTAATRSAMSGKNYLFQLKSCGLIRNCPPDGEALH
jgi:hypothetical protein